VTSEFKDRRKTDLKELNDMDVAHSNIYMVYAWKKIKVMLLEHFSAAVSCKLSIPLICTYTNS